MDINEEYKNIILALTEDHTFESDCDLDPEEIEEAAKRHRGLLVYKKIKLFKSVGDNDGVIQLETEDVSLFEKVRTFMKQLPEIYHKCIGCPCHEYNYPECGKCIYYELCNNAQQVYPDECNEKDCFEFFSYIESQNDIK